MDRIEKQFQKFHKDNPHILKLILKFIRKVRRTGRETYSINAIFERIRWHVEIETNGDDFKMNNNYRSRYVRLIERKYPRYRGFFKTRKLSSE